jgi:hypothetical protein
MYTEISTHIHIYVNVMFSLFYCDITFVPIKQGLTGTSPQTKLFKILSQFYNFYTPNDGKTDAMRLLGTLSKILVLNISKGQKA